ncbi:hypothetical protein ASPZODRAFT_141289 [Penicilliopsis zonata CBS 506.65]|uniref:Rhodanese domain-containing protein n=1 Tax=Penicilliopsis zonata CBS 506.65 TaxID=1073090 RepID=A0A1L9SKI8_9EURO|nr:hypothetical protein ASPZODRAFT_141289 [Penicilliopsis zonata CBS 506.65]OJJ47718.1 hypothetical protein ASPZODRAFT_141289 [Penicilliopsis zonata CBS 506.65]
MATLQPFRRTLAGSSFRTTLVLRRNGVSAVTPSLFVHGVKRLTTGTNTLNRSKIQSADERQPRQGLKQQQLRYSSQGDTPAFKQWGFEDINAALDANEASPSLTPQKNLILIDVREPAELLATGTIPGAVCIPLASQPDAIFLTPQEFETRFGFPKPGEADGDADAVAKTAPIVFFCKAGVRARAAAQLAVQAGYDPERVGVYSGSWLDWADKKGRVEKWEKDE